MFVSNQYSQLSISLGSVCMYSTNHGSKTFEKRLVSILRVYSPFPIHDSLNNRAQQLFTEHLHYIKCYMSSREDLQCMRGCEVTHKCYTTFRKGLELSRIFCSPMGNGFWIKDVHVIKLKPINGFPENLFLICFFFFFLERVSSVALAGLEFTV